MAKIVFLITTVVIFFASIELGASEVSCGGHSASSCSGCPQQSGSAGESWCHGECTWKSGQCVSKSSGYSSYSTGGGRSISGSCVQSDNSDSWYFKNKGKAILNKHNNLRRQFGVPDLKWSARIEYEIYDIMINKSPGCTHDATNVYKADIKSKAGDILKCEKNWLGHFENIAQGHSSELAGVQAWINEGPGGGHHDNIVNPDVKWIGCYTKDKCYKCVYWGV